MLNAISFLKEDHQRIAGLFELFAGSGRLNEKLALFQQIKDEIELHTFLEEKVFYPSLSKYYELTDLIDSSYEAHDEIDDLIDELEQMEPEGVEEAELSHGAFDDAVEELRLKFQRHVDDEERELFPEARDLLDSEDMQSLASEMNELRSLDRAA